MFGLFELFEVDLEFPGNVGSQGQSDHGRTDDSLTNT